MSDLDEPVLSDDYPIYGDYLYVVDGKVYKSDWHGITVGQLKAREGFKKSGVAIFSEDVMLTIRL